MENHHTFPDSTDCTYYLVCRFCNRIRPRDLFADKTTSNCHHLFDSFGEIITRLRRSDPNCDFLALTLENAICIECLHAHVSTAKTSRIRCPLPGARRVCGGLFSPGDIQRHLTPIEFKRYVELRRKENKAPPKILACTVCDATLSASTLPAHRVTAGCRHDITACLSCVRESIVADVTDANWAHPSCPECQVLLSHAEISALVPQTVLDRHDEHMFLARIARVPEFRWCLRAGCDSGQIHEGGEASPIVTCRKCEEKMCYVHGVRWHEGQTCAAFQAEMERKEREEAAVAAAGVKATLKRLQTKTKACPGLGCGVRIEKDGGCDHMTCKRCGHHFSWLYPR